MDDSIASRDRWQFALRPERGMFLSRARLRADSTVRAIAPLLLPPDGHARLLAAHRLVWSLMADDTN